MCSNVRALVWFHWENTGEFPALEGVLLRRHDRHASTWSAGRRHDREQCTREAVQIQRREPIRNNAQDMSASCPMNGVYLDVETAPCNPSYPWWCSNLSQRLCLPALSGNVLKEGIPAQWKDAKRQNECYVLHWSFFYQKEYIQMSPVSNHQHFDINTFLTLTLVTVI